MGKRLSNSDLPAMRPLRRAALTGRFIGLAAIVLGTVLLVTLLQLRPDDRKLAMPIHVALALCFIIPGLLYFILAVGILRGRRWAVLGAWGLAMLDMALMGLLFVIYWTAPGAMLIRLIAGLFVVALAVLTMQLGRAFESLKRSAPLADK